MSSFKSFVENALVVEPMLYLVHTTDVYSFRSMLGEPVIRATDCDVYGDKRSYFFYGRPAYRPHPDVEAHSIDALHLVSLVFEISTSAAPSCLMPFDSGAMERGMYSAVLHPKMKRQDFDLGNEWRVAGKLVDAFYGSNLSYFEGTPRDEIKAEPLELEVNAYLALINTRGKTPFDDRRGCIEVQYTQDIPISIENLKAIILPSRAAKDEKVKKFARDRNSIIISYTCHHSKPSESVGVISSKVEEYYLKEGLM